jgi:pimeloyl-ACP methyl ester carboxylesterase
MKVMMVPRLIFVIAAVLVWPLAAEARLPVVQKASPFESSYVFLPNDGKLHPGIVLLHGSEGGSVRNMWVHALLLAESGFSVMTYCWWDCGRDVRVEPFAGLMADVELEGAVKAMDWFGKSAYLPKGAPLGLYGISKGAELAMLIAAREAELPFRLSTLALHSPNDVVEKGLNINWLDSRCWDCPEGTKTCNFQARYWNRACGKIDGEFSPADRDSLPMWRWKGQRLALGSRIEIEKFTGNLLITAGALDTDWESDKGRVKRIESALRKAGRQAEIHVFPKEGHSFGLEAEQERKELVDHFFRKHLQKH